MLNKEKLSSIFDSFYKKINHPIGMSVSISEMDSIIFSKSYGIRNSESQQRINEDTIFNIGSASKIFTTLAVLILVDMGKLALNNKVVNYIEFFRMKDPRYKDITVRSLLNHSSGLYGSTFNGGVGYSFRDIRKNFLEELQESYLQFSPNEMAVYCDDGFFLAQILVEKVSGLPYTSFLKKYIFEKIGLHRTGKSLGERKHDKNVAYSLNQQRTFRNETISMYGVAGLSSSSRDLCKLAVGLMRDRTLISDKMYRELLKTQLSSFFIAAGERFGFGLGWDFTGKFLDTTVLIKRGKTSEYSAIFMLLPELKISVSILLAEVNDNIKTLEGSVLNALIGKTSAQNIQVHSSNKVHSEFQGLWVNRADVWEFKQSNKGNNISAVAKFLGVKKVFTYSPQNETFTDDNNDVYLLKNIYDNLYFCKLNRTFQTILPIFKKLELKDFSSANNDIADKFSNQLWVREKAYLDEISYSTKTTHMIKPLKVTSYRYESNYPLINFQGVKMFISPNRAVPLSFAPGQSDLQILNQKNDMVSVKFSGLTYGRIF